MAVSIAAIAPIASSTDNAVSTWNGTDGSLLQDSTLISDGTSTKPSADNGMSLGVSGTAWSDLFLANGAVINFNASEVTITHSTNQIVQSGARMSFLAPTLTSGSTDDYGLNISQVLSDGGAAGGSDLYAGFQVTLTQTNVTGWDEVYGFRITVGGNAYYELATKAGGTTSFNKRGNADGVDIDFNYATTGLPNMFFIDCGSDFVSIGTNSEGVTGAVLSIQNGLTTHMGTSLGTTSQYLYRNSNDAFGSANLYRKSRNTTIGAHTVVADNDVVHSFRAYGSDGSAYVEGAQIVFAVDGTPGAGDVPMEIQFNTQTPTGSLTVKGRAKASGNFAWGSDRDDAKMAVDQSSTTGALPVLLLDQADVSEEFIRLVGESTTDSSQSLVDAADLASPGSIVGWFKIYVEDVQATNPITDGVYYVPFYTTPTA